jgi:hypothetical protein
MTTLTTDKLRAVFHGSFRCVGVKRVTNSESYRRLKHKSAIQEQGGYKDSLCKIYDYYGNGFKHGGIESNDDFKSFKIK